MKGKYIIGDIHGCFKTLQALIKLLPEDADLIFVGDLIDRGPSSRKVVQFVKENNYICIQGNHEEMMVSAYEDSIEFGDSVLDSDWGRNGGEVFLEEYALDDGYDLEAIQEDYDYFKTLPTFYIDDLVDDKGRKLLVTHTSAGDIIDSYLVAREKVLGGVTSEVTEHIIIDLAHQVSNGDMLMQWDRRVPKKIQENFFNVFGHTPIDNYAFKGGIGGEDKVNGCLTEDLIIIDKERGYANIDSGCVYSKKRYGKYRGSMTAIHFPSLEIIQHENIDYD